MNIPTQLTILRLISVPFFMYFLSSNTPTSRWIAFVIFGLAALTDFIDGYLARKLNQITDLGKLLDPIADKVLVVAALTGLVELGEIPAWIVVVIIAREFMVSVFRTLMASKGKVLAAGYWGKVKTTIQILAILLILANNFPASIIGVDLDVIMLYVAVVLTIISGAEYLISNREFFKS